MAYIKRDDLAGYTIGKHKNDFGYEISPLKFQKTLYLLFSMWAGNPVNINNDMNANENIEYTNMLDEYLFEPEFQAWKYGPVDKDLYFDFKDNKIESKDDLIFIDENCQDISIVSPFVNSIMDQAFQINDFALVRLTHDDGCLSSKLSYLI